MKFTIQTSIEINAPSDEVWKHLTNLEQYQQWNPFIVEAEGRIALGETLSCKPFTPNGRQYSFRPKVTHYQEGKAFSWTGDVIHPLIASGLHIFEIQETNTQQTKLIHNEEFSGLVSPLIILFAGKKTKEGFNLMNEALKKRVEGN